MPTCSSSHTQLHLALLNNGRSHVFPINSNPAKSREISHLVPKWWTRWKHKIEKMAASTKKTTGLQETRAISHGSPSMTWETTLKPSTKESRAAEDEESNVHTTCFISFKHTVKTDFHHYGLKRNQVRKKDPKVTPLTRRKLAAAHMDKSNVFWRKQ